MKHPSPTSSGAKGERDYRLVVEPSDDFPTCLAEALDILVDRAARHGLVEVAHLLEVAALAARDAAASMTGQPCPPESKGDCFPCTPA